jgi:Fic family protein
MDLPKFNAKAGKLIRRSATFGREFMEFDYFSPNEIPNMKDFCNDLSLIELSNEANRAIGELHGLINNIGMVGSLKLFIDPYLRKEAVDSSEIEGTKVSLTDVFLSEAGSKKPQIFNPNVKEVVNFVRAIDYSLLQLKKGRKISKELLNDVHRILLEGTRGQDKKIGDFRQQQNWIEGNDVLDARFVPPSEEEVERLMNYLSDYINTEEGYMRLIKAGLIHYYFETIHPYEDGNGRVGRTLILLYLIQAKILNEPILHLSPYFKRNKETYYNLLMNVRETGDYNRWIKFFLKGVTEVAINTSNKVRKLVKLYNDYRKKLVDEKATPISFKLLDRFFERPYSFITLLQEELKEDYPKTKRGLNYLLKCKIIILYTRQRRNKIYLAPDILKIIEEDLI